MNLVRNVTVTKESSRDWRQNTSCESIRVDLDLNPRATFMVASHYTDAMSYVGVTNAEMRQRLTEMDGRGIAHSVAGQVREEIEQSVMRLLGFLKPGERGSLSRA